MRNKKDKNKTRDSGPDLLKKRAGLIISQLEKLYPQARCSLNFENPLQLLIATILSAQCTDKRVNMVTPALFKKYRNAADFASARPEELMEMIRSTGFFRNKAKNIMACCQTLVRVFGGQVPSGMQELLTLQGVARKTANVVLANAFGINEGIAVDTHVIRVTNRLGLTKNKNPQLIEKDLMKFIPREKWGQFTHLIIEFGRDKCKAQSPLCPLCPFQKICPWYQSQKLSD
jgi:endonuclease-3